MSKYEKLIEYIISEQDDLARELFHEIVVEKSRSIYESLMDETEMGGSPVEDLVDEISVDESDMYEETDTDDEDDMMAMPDNGGDMMAMPDDEGGEGEDDEDNMMSMSDGEGGEDEDEENDVDTDDELEDRVDDLESALDDLKAEFDKIMAGNESDEEDDSEDDEENLVREYVEKVGLPANKSEGHEVGRGGSVAVQKTSPGLQKANNMGGSAANIVAGGAESNPDGTSAKKPSNYGTKGQGQLKGAGSYENVPGANTKGYKTRASAKHGEESGVNKSSIEPGN